MRTRLIDRMRAYAERDPLRLHTPGHKGELYPLDMTELADDSFPGSAVRDAEAYIAEVYGAKHAHLLCGGSSQGVKSAVYYAGVNAVFDVNSHRSVFDGFTLSGKKCYTAGERGSVKALTVEQIDRALRPDVKAVVVTTPTYYGYVADVSAISDYCAKNGLMFIADSAHGAHFGMNSRLPKSAAPYCDIVNVSSHKTLSALTQSAILFDNLDATESDRLKKTVELMGTTSPSYPLYASIECAVENAAGSSARYEALYAPTEALKAELPFLKNDDFTRLVLDCRALDVDANALNVTLSRRGVYCELCDGKRLVFILTAEDDDKTVERLRVALTAAISEIR